MRLLWARLATMTAREFAWSCFSVMAIVLTLYGGFKAGRIGHTGTLRTTSSYAAGR